MKIDFPVYVYEKVNFFTAFKLCCMCFASADQRSGKVQD